MDSLSETGVGGRISELIHALGSHDGFKRQHARLALIELGKPVVPHLLHALDEGDEYVRWEAVTALRTLKDPVAATALVNALMDETLEVRWLAAEALIALGQTALVPLMRSLIIHFDSLWLRQGAHHILYALEHANVLDEPSTRVLNSLRAFEPVVAVPVAARNALHALTRANL